MARVLLVEDEPDLTFALTVRLKHAGYDCETATTGKEGYAMARKQLPDLVITDLLMPEGDGYELCQELAADKLTASIPVLVLTAVPPYTLKRRLGETGASPYLPKQVRVLHKPFDSDVFMRTIGEMLAGKKIGGDPDGKEEHSGRG